MMDWTAPEIIAAIISSAGTVLAAVLASCAAWMLGRQIGQRERLKMQLCEAQADIEFLLAVETRHCEMHREQSGQSSKMKVRDHVRLARGLTWSGRHTPGRAEVARLRAALHIHTPYSF